MLTEREQEVLKLMSEGLTNKEIAKTLWIAEPTAKKNIQSIYKKLNVKDRVNAVIYYLKGGQAMSKLDEAIEILRKAETDDEIIAAVELVKRARRNEA